MSVLIQDTEGLLNNNFGKITYIRIVFCANFLLIFRNK